LRPSRVLRALCGKGRHQAKAGVWLCGFYDVLRNQYVVSREGRKGSAKGRKGGRLALPERR